MGPTRSSSEQGWGWPGRAGYRASVLGGGLFVTGHGLPIECGTLG